MAKKKQSPEDVAGQFSDDEMDQIKRYGQALGGKPTPFDEEVESHLAGMEANAAKMRAAQTGGASLGPSQFDQDQAKQTGAIQRQADVQGTKQALQAQSQSPPLSPPQASGGADGATQPLPAQAAPQPPPGPTQGMPAPGMAPPPAPGGPAPDDEEGPPQ